MPTFRIGKILEVKDALLEQVCHEYIGSMMAGELFLQFAHDIHSVGAPAADFEAVLGTVRSVAGRDLTSEAARELAWRVAGNQGVLTGKSRRGWTPVSPWTGQAKLEWAPVEVVEIHRTKRKYKPKDKSKAASDGFVHRVGAVVTLQVLAGGPAGRTTQKFWSTDLCEVVKVAFGFSRFNREKHSRVVSKVQSWSFLDVHEFFGMRLMGLLSPDHGTYPDFGFAEFRATSSTVKHNRALMVMRRRDEFECPIGKSVDEDCFDCHMGVDRCPAACHLATYVAGGCAHCGNPDVWLSRAGSDRCISCMQ